MDRNSTWCNRNPGVIGIDTNILLRWLIDGSIRDDDAPRQTDLVSEMILGGNETCFANVVVIAETLWVLANPMRQPKSVQIEVAKRLLSSFNVEVSEREAISGAIAAFDHSSAGLIDCLIGEMNSLAGCKTTITFDKKAARMPGFTLLT